MLCTQDAAFGRRRLFASIGWGGLAPLTGWVVGRFGVRCNIYFYMAFALLAALPICLLPVDALGAKKVKSGGRPSLSEEEEEESGKAQIEDSASSRGIRSSSAVPGATPRRAQQAVRKQMKTRSALPLLAAGKGSERSNAWGGGSTEHGSQGSKDNSGVQSSGEGEAAGQWDLEAGHHVEEGSGSPKVGDAASPDLLNSALCLCPVLCGLLWCVPAAVLAKPEAVPRYPGCAVAR